jgi:predicted phosphodiesterase
MKIQVLSDLHLEFGHMHFSKAEGADVLVLAGDIGTMKTASYLGFVEDWAEKFQHVIYVAGNHEFYKTDIDISISRLREWSKVIENMHFLENDYVIIDDVAFFGATLWSDFRVDPMASFTANNSMNDFRRISKNGYANAFRAEDAQEKHDASVAWLKTALQKIQAENKVVVTHHAPTFRGILPEYQNSMLNCAFATDLEWMMDLYAPDVWIHGHMHNSVDLTLWHTRVICNPRGYVGHELNEQFDKVKVIEI